MSEQQVYTKEENVQDSKDYLLIEGRNAKMNYIKEMNAFFDWLEWNQVSPSAINLWYALMHIYNKSGWTSPFSVAESVLSMKTGLAGRTLRKARGELKELGRIDFVSVRGKAPQYKIISLASSETTPALHAKDNAVRHAEVGSSLNRSENTSVPYTEEHTEERTTLHAAVRTEVGSAFERSENISAEHAALRSTLIKQNETKETNPKQQQQQQSVYREKRGEKETGENQVVVDEGYGKLTRFYEAKIGQLTPPIGEMLKRMEAKSGVTLTLYALEVALEANAGSKMHYAAAVLKSWENRNILTVEEAKSLGKRRKNDKPRSLECPV